MMGEAPISLFCVCFNKRASVWCFLLPELIMIGVGRRERAAIGFYEQKTNKINLLCWVNIWGIFWGAIGLNITNKYGTIVQFIYLWDHPPTVHTPNTEYLLRNLNFAPIPKQNTYFSLFLLHLCWPQKSLKRRMSSQLMIPGYVAPAGLSSAQRPWPGHNLTISPASLSS